MVLGSYGCFSVHPKALSQGVAMCSQKTTYSSETTASSFYDSNPVMRKLRRLHQRFARTRCLKPTRVNKKAFNTLVNCETLAYKQQMHEAAVEYWEFGKGEANAWAPNSVPGSAFAATFMEWRRLQMALRTAVAQAEKASWRLLCQIAETIDNPSLLSALARHECSHVRAAVADNVHTYLETLGVLANDEDPDVRYAVARITTYRLLSSKVYWRMKILTWPAALSAQLRA